MSSEIELLRQNRPAYRFRQTEGARVRRGALFIPSAGRAELQYGHEDKGQGTRRTQDPGREVPRRRSLGHLGLRRLLVETPHVVVVLFGLPEGHGSYFPDVGLGDAISLCESRKAASTFR